ncbi:MAG TPA: FAD-dependent oxidoreductase [Candidatus Dormibacteraeota bacterium]|nr:FAD-dependent oxidoreductase [Candidatus Dormibacteraeota bacterium]
MPGRGLHGGRRVHVLDRDGAAARRDRDGRGWDVRGMSVERVIVVGAGIAGLATAAALGDGRSVTVVDRLPAVGGACGWDERTVREMERECRLADVRFALGTTALRWSLGRLLIAAPGSIGWLDADRLVYAGGCRPATAAEMRLVGGRLAGVLSAMVAVHLLDAGVRLGRRPVILGETDFGAEVAERIHRLGAPVRVVAPEAGPRPAYADEWWPGWRAIRARGAGRVRELEIGVGERREWLACDAVVLADAIRPLRNVEGALADDDPLTFVQLAAPHAPIADTVAFARAVAARLSSSLSRSEGAA